MVLLVIVRSPATVVLPAPSSSVLLSVLIVASFTTVNKAVPVEENITHELVVEAEDWK